MYQVTEPLPIPAGVDPISNEDFFAGYDPARYRNPAVAVDLVLVDPLLRVRLIRRDNPPDHLKLALPGAFVLPGEPLWDTTQRAILRHVTEIHPNAAGELEPLQMHVFDGVGRDLRDRVLSVAHFCGWPGAFPDLVVDGWVPMHEAIHMNLAFDHASMIEYALGYLRRRVWDPEVMQMFFPLGFAVSDYRKLYECITGHKVNGSNFRKKALGLGVIEPLDRIGQGKTTLYRFSSNNQAP